MLLAKSILPYASLYVTGLKKWFILDDDAAKNTLNFSDDQYIKKKF